MTIAQTPFDDMAADVILRSHDGVDFYVYRTVLAIASPFFKDMFSLPQTIQAREQTVRQPAPAVVDFSEDSQTLDHLLRLCYPIIDPVIKELTEVEDALEAAIKYQMVEATVILQALLRTFGPSDPLKVFVIACRLQLEAEAKAAAQHWRRKCPQGISTKGKPPDWTVTSAGASYLPEMAQISAGSLFRLLCFVRTGNEPPSFLEADCPPTVTPSGDAKENTVSEHLFVYEDADIILQSSDGIDFRVHKVIISLASTDLVDKSSITHDALPVIVVPENSHTLAKLLELCYPVGDSDLGDLNTAHAVLSAAIKYKMTKVIQLAKKQWMGLVKTAPLRVYFIAVRYGWKEEAQEAARCVANQPIENVYVPEMEFMSAVVYHRLLRYHHNYRSAIAAITCNYEKKSNESWTADFSNWPNGGYVNRGNEAAVPMLIAGPIVQRELRASRANNRPNNYSSYPVVTTPDVRTLIDESHELDNKLREALSKVSHIHRLDK